MLPPLLLFTAELGELRLALSALLT